MSWNTSRILNDLEYEINENKQDISMLEQKTLYISDQLSVDGTVFVNNVYSEAFVKNGGTSTEYLMADGSTTTSSQQGQPNIYLYNNNNSGTPEPASGQIRANDPNNQNVTELYISHITSDGIDIDVFLQQITTISVIYMQDRNNSNNNVRFNVTGVIIDNPNLYVTVPVLFDIAQGSGSIDFGDGHPLFMSIFDNSQLIDSRISAVETKTQHQSATSLETRFNSPINMFDHKIYNVADPVDLSDVSTKNYVDTSISALDLASYTPLSDFNNLASTVTTQGQYINELEVVTQNQSATASLTTFVDSTQLLLDTNQFFGIKSLDLLSNYLIVTPTSINTYLPINMDAKELLNVSGVKISGADTSNYFIKSNGTVDTNTYLQSADLSALETKTQNITGSTTLNTFTKGSIFKLSTGQNFTISDDTSPFSVTKLIVNNTGISALLPLTMNNNKITSLGTPVDSSDATRKDYVDGLISPLQVKTQNLTGNSIVSTFTKNIQFKLDDTEYFDILNSAFISVSKFTVSNTSVQASIPITATSFIRSGGLTTQFLKANGDIDSNTYVTTASIAGKLNIDGSNAMTGALNMGAQAINNSGIVSAVGFIKNGGLSSEFLKANGVSDPRTFSGLQVIQSNFQVGVNGVTTEVNLTASPDIGSYTWTDISVGFTRRWKFYAISTRGNGNTVYTMRFKSSLGNMFEWVLPNLPQSITNQPIEITMTVTRRLPTSLVFYGKWDCSSTGTNLGFWTATVSTTNVPALVNGSTYNVSIQSDNANANITFQYIEVQNIYTG